MSKSLGIDLALNERDITRWRSHLLPTATCVVFMGAVGSDGYGRFAICNVGERQRTVTPHQVAAVLAGGELQAGVTILHDCDLRLCCRTDPGHVRVATQGENMRQAAWRGRAAGPRPGLVDVRGKAGASRAVQAALRKASDRSPEALAATLAAVVAAGDPRASLIPLF
ncbi:MAG: hypothetical protein ACR2P2_10995 [Nakamurella sp.]